MVFWPVLVVVLLLPLFGAIFLRFFPLLQRREKKTVAFFHPYTNDGGGGERVLWCAIRALQEVSPGVTVAVYTGDAATPESLAERAMQRFGVQLQGPIKVVPLTQRLWIEASTYPMFTLAGQSLGSILLAWEALSLLTPSLFIDTAGHAFTYPVARLFGCQVACYTHYPTVSTDMVSRVKKREALYNNSATVAASPALSEAKAFYYRVFAYLYGCAGRCSSVIMVNSSWTLGHVSTTWNCPQRIFRVFPPCDTAALQRYPLERSGDRYLVSVAQFRPEKNHALQLRSFAEACSQSPASLQGVRLKLVGSCRGKEDARRVEQLESLAVALGVEGRVEFCVDVPYGRLQEYVGGAVAGLHSMVDEHFGISVVDYMAGGAIPIAHDSGGVKADIVVPSQGEEAVGFLAKSKEEYAEAILKVVGMEGEARMRMAERSRRRAARFSETEFDLAFKEALQPQLTKLGL